MSRIAVGIAAATLLVACASNPIQGGPRPPQGPGPGGTNFGRWDIDAEGAVDQGFRRFIAERWNGGDAAEARKVFEEDGFKCAKGVRPDGRPAPTLECERVYSANDDVHAWIIEFWPSEADPKAHYTRMHMRDPLKNYNDRGN